MNSKEVISLENSVCAHIYESFPVVLSHGKGVWLWDLEGNQYLDMMAAYSAVTFGHGHPRLLQALHEQASTLAVTSRAFYTDKLAPFLEKACALSGFEMGIPMNSGAEAVETAIKAVRRWGYEHKHIPDGKGEIIVADNNFHGRTTTIISFSTEPHYKKGFTPLTPGFKSVPFGDIEALKQAISAETCAFLVEPIQGEGGIILPPLGYLREVSRVCKEKGILLILDEIQSGLGRSGKMFAFQHEQIQPDGLILGKALGGGLLPLSLFLSRRDILCFMTPGSHGSTFGGNPLACAVGHTSLCLLQEEDLVSRSAELGEYMHKQLKKIRSPLIKEIRGSGLWVGIDTDASRVNARQLCDAMRSKGVLTKETHHTVIRFSPPLVISRDEIDFAVTVLEESLAEMEQGNATCSPSQ